ncbi:MAG: hypothetical protein C4576_02370 [Desulfobacteraceae bacterium]|nr:MAG: hypothetical protein C4576_02370 [Desulfobacteraceae bacterium]
MKSLQGAAFSYSEIRAIVHESLVRAGRKENAAYNRDVLDAIEDLTGLADSELAEIALRVRHRRDGFFSIGQQAVIAGRFLFCIGALLHLVTRFFPNFSS